MIFAKTDSYTLYHGKMQEELKNLPDCSVDSIITDPPYELGFMGKSWGSSGVAFQPDTWKECLRVLKPGGHILAFGGSRTYHRIACAIEDAGFEIRDTIMWLYGSGFPKSMNIGLALDKKNGVDNRTGNVVKGMGNNNTSSMKNGLGESQEFASEYEERVAQNEWNGWGTCLKPAFEPVIMARKPVDGSILNNCETWGVGGINIDECRIPLSDNEPDGRVGTDAVMNTDGEKMWYGENGYAGKEVKVYKDNGRFPANVITDGSDEVAQGFPNGDASGSAMRYFYCAKTSRKDRDEGLDAFEEKQMYKCDNSFGSLEILGTTDGGRAPVKNIHPTVKPASLMQYLIRLVSPKGAVILDPFMGSGSTGKATMLENRERNANYKFIGIEMTDEYLPIAEARIKFGANYVPEKDTKKNVPVKPTVNTNEALEVSEKLKCAKLW